MGLLRQIARPAWVATGPIRRPLARAWHASIRRAVAAALEEHAARPEGERAALARIEATYPPALGRIEHALGVIAEDARVARDYAQHHGAEANALMDGVIRELSRLQLLVEELGERVDEASAGGPPGLGVVADVARREVG
jgi:hypothetical protein